MAEAVKDFLEVLDNRIQKNIDSRTPDFIKQRAATVVQYDNKDKKTYVTFIDDPSQQIHMYMNKTGSVFEEGDIVRVFYTTNIDKGWIGLGTGILEGNDDRLEPITAISVNSDVDYTISTNAGIERYIAAFEET